MKNLKCLSPVLGVLFVVACFYVSASGQSAEDRNILGAITAAGSSVRFEVAAPYSGVTMTVSAPDGRVFRKEFKAGTTPEFTVVDAQGERLPDGQYIYELRLTPSFSLGMKETLAAARGKDDDPESVRATRKRGMRAAQNLVQSGGFSILNGAIFVPGAVEGTGRRLTGRPTEQPRLTGSPGASLSRLRQQHHLSFSTMPDQVIPDDLIVQGSACVGLDCVNGEVFGFDTIRVKENNTRIQFDDTSVSAGFATNNWQIRANNSAAGGPNFLAFVDQGATGNSETGTIVFEVDAGAPANSLRVSSNGKIGLRTGTPVLDIHMNTSDTPATRYEQNNSGGFTAQTWDVAGNEANFFVRDVTGGSRLPFRIRPGAPTSSIDISASGDVGIGIQTPTKKLHVFGANSQILVDRPANTAGNYALVNFATNGVQKFFFGMNSDSDPNLDKLSFFDSAASLTIPVMTFTGGNVGIGTTAPTDKLSVNGTASKPGGGSWAVFSDERLKTIKGHFNSGLKAVMQLQPLRYEYKQNNALGLESKNQHVGFGAQTLQQVIPEAVSQNDNGYLQVNNDPIIWTMLNAIKEQQQEIQQLKAQVRQLKAATRRRR